MFKAPRRPHETRCGICAKTIADSDVCADHDHATGFFRDWLCKNCNCAIGLFNDNTSICLSASLYLHKHQHNGKTSHYFT